MQNKVAVVILCWNGRKLLETFLPSLVQYQSADSEIVVADNFSTDDSVDYLKMNFPSVRLLALEKNFGFAEGYNQAIRRIDAEFIVLINQDVAVTGDWLPPMMSMMESDERVAAVQPKIKSHLQRTHFEYAGAAGGWIDQWGYTFCRGRVFNVIEEDKNQYDDVAEIFWASGACMLVRKKIYEQLGGLDANFFAHMEEIDLCWRMKNAKHKIMYCPSSTVYHLGGGSLPQGNPFKTYLNFRNNLIMLVKNLPKKRSFATILFRMWLDQIAALKALLSGNTKDFAAIWIAHFHFIGGLSKWKKKRCEVSVPLKGHSGVYHGSIVWDFFVRGKKTFTASNRHHDQIL